MRILKSVLAILLLVCMFASCAKTPTPEAPSPATQDITTTSTVEEPKEPTEEDLYPEQIKQLLAGNKPYSLEFTSNGDGTCYVSRLYLNNQYKTAFDIVIPEKSPAGDTVTGIDLGNSLTDPGDVVPLFLTKNQIDEILIQVEADYPDLEGGRIVNWWGNAYGEYDISKMATLLRQEMIKRYPSLEYTNVIFNWFPKMSNTRDTFMRLKTAGITLAVAKQCYEDLMQEARDAGAPEETLTMYKELLEAMPVYVNQSEYVRYLHIPSSVSNINEESLSYLMFEFEYDGECIERGVVLPELDLTTTKAINDILAASLPREYNFTIFSQSTSAEGYEGLSNFAVYSPAEPQDDILAWHYVDGVPTFWK